MFVFEDIVRLDDRYQQVFTGEEAESGLSP